MKHQSIITGLRLTANGITFLAGFCLLFFTLRRWLFLLFSLKTAPPSHQAVQLEWPTILLLVPFRNEKKQLPYLLAALAQLDYPPTRLHILCLDDGSTDGSHRLAQQWAAKAVNRQVKILPHNVGKAITLQKGVESNHQTELVVVYDADEQPEPAALKQLVIPFNDPSVGAVTGRRLVSNPLATPIASYAAFENLLLQYITNPAKERLDLAPAILGSNCAYRRTALECVGGFLPGALLEDSDLTVKLARAGWKLHYAPGARAYFAAPTTITGYWRQHTRWAAGFQAVTRQQTAATLRQTHLPWRLRLELSAFALGYVDRIALLWTLNRLGKKLCTGSPARWLLTIITANLITPLVQVMVALYHSNAPSLLWYRIPYLPLFLPLDMLMALVGTLRQEITWEQRSL